MTKFEYSCLLCGQRYPGSAAKLSFRLCCDTCGEKSLLQAIYDPDTESLTPPNTSSLTPWQRLGFTADTASSTNFFQYKNWLPAYSTFSDVSLPAVWPSKGLAAELGLKDLDLLFSGYAPERGARLLSGTFKEFEAYSVLSYVYGSCPKDKVLVLASAGNTARAFAEVAIRHDLPVVLVVPYPALQKMELTVEPKQNSKVIFIATKHLNDDEPSEYAEAIAVSQMLCESEHFFPEGGVRNIARRDGLGIGYLHAQYSRSLRSCATIPYRYYFQAVGSGTGAIGSYNMYQRLKQSNCIPKEHQLSLMLAQNAPFTPIVEHWQKKTRTFEPYTPSESLKRNKNMLAPVLANRNPPYSLCGGLADLLEDSSGATFAISNQELRDMQALCSATEGIDIVPAAAVALGALKRAVAENLVKPEEPVLLHLTGGGCKRLEEDFPHRHQVKAITTVDLNELQNSSAKQSQLLQILEREFGF